MHCSRARPSTGAVVVNTAITLYSCFLACPLLMDHGPSFLAWQCAVAAVWSSAVHAVMWYIEWCGGVQWC